MRTATALGLAVVVGCGDNLPAPPDCTLYAPPTGPLSDPYAIPLPDTCVEGGLVDAVGRWMMYEPDSRAAFDYPRYELACGRVRRVGRPEYVEYDSGFVEQMWSDGTRFMVRGVSVGAWSDGTPLMFVMATVTCRLPDGTLAGTYRSVQIDDGVEGDPYTITLVGERFAPKDELASGLELIGSVAIGVDDEPIAGLNVVADGGYAYVAANGGLDVIDVRNRSAPRAVGHAGTYYNDVRIVHAGGRVIAFGANETTDIIDVTDPDDPTIVGALDMYSHSLQLDSRGNASLYLATTDRDIPVFDVSDPLAPVLLGDVVLPGSVPYVDAIHDLFVDGSTLYVNDSWSGTIALDVSAGLDAPVELARFAPPFEPYSHASWAGTAGGRPIVLAGEEGGVGPVDGMAFLHVLDGDRASPGFMTEIGRYQTRREVGIHNFQLVGDRAYIAYYQDGVRVVDLSDPTQPRELAHYNTWDDETAYGYVFEGALGIRVVDGLIYVADSERGLLILRER
jgi:hypothetical protein